MADTNISATFQLDNADALQRVSKLQQALLDQKNILADIEKQFGDTSNQYLIQNAKVVQATSDLNDGLKDIAGHVSKFDSFKTALSGIQGGFQAVSGVLSLFGEKSEVVEKALVGVKTALDITEGISSISKGIEAVKALSAAIGGLGTGAVLGVVIFLITKLGDLKNLFGQTKSNAEILDDINKKAIETYVQEKSTIEALVREAQNENTSKEQKLQILKQLKEQSPEYFKNIKDEKDLTDKLTIAYQNYSKALLLGAQIKAAQSLASEDEQNLVQAKIDRQTALKNAENIIGVRDRFNVENKTKVQSNPQAIREILSLNEQLTALDNTSEKYKQAKKKIDDLTASLTSTDAQTLQAIKTNKNGINKEFDAQEEEINKRLKPYNAFIDAKSSELAQLQFSNGTKDANSADNTKELKGKALKQQLASQMDLYKAEEQLAIENAQSLNKTQEDIYLNERRIREQRIQTLQEYLDKAKNIKGKEGENLRKEIAGELKKAIGDYNKLNDDFAKQQLDKEAQNLVNIAKNVKLPVVEEQAPKSPEEEQREKDKKEQNERNSANRKVGKDVDDENARIAQASQSQYEKQLAAIQKFYDDRKDIVIKGSVEQKKLTEYYQRETQKVERQILNERLQMTAGTLGQLSDLFGKQTAAGKVAAIAEATINTYLAASKALTGIPKGNPFGATMAIIQAGIIIATGLKNVKELAKTPVPNGGASTSIGDTSLSSPAPLQPVIQQTNTTLNQNQLNQIGNATVRAFVLESDISNNQEKIARLNRAARLGG